jgi:rubrerythrin
MGRIDKSEIVDAINTAIRGERYAHGAFEKYAEKTSCDECRAAFKDIAATKQRHIALLEARLGALGEKETFKRRAVEPTRPSRVGCNRATTRPLCNARSATCKQASWIQTICAIR